MGQKGWKYLKMGECPACGEAGARLYVPVLDGTPLDVKGMELVNGVHIPHFNPVCKSCYKALSLEQICPDHRLPTKRDSGLCNLCNPVKNDTLTSEQGNLVKEELTDVLKRLYKHSLKIGR